MSTAIPEIPMTARLRIETRKMFNTRGQILMFVGIGVFMLAMVALVFGTMSADERTFGNIAQALLVPLIYLLPVVGIISMSSEWRGSAMVTYTLDPRRSRVFWAKVLVLVALVIVLIASVMAVSAVLAWATGAPFEPLRDIAMLHLGSLAGIGGLTLAGAGLGAALLNVALGIVIQLAFMPLLPQVLSMSSVTKPIVPWVDLNGLMQLLLGAMWPDDLLKAASVLTLWIALPLVVGLWRNAHKEA